MTQRFKYLGDDPVDIDALHLVNVTTGTYVEVDDPERAKSMHTSDIWEHIPDPERSKAAKKAAAENQEG